MMSAYRVLRCTAIKETIIFPRLPGASRGLPDLLSRKYKQTGTRVRRRCTVFGTAVLLRAWSRDCGVHDNWRPRGSGPLFQRAATTTTLGIAAAIGLSKPLVQAPSPAYHTTPYRRHSSKGRREEELQRYAVNTTAALCFPRQNICIVPVLYQRADSVVKGPSVRHSTCLLRWCVDQAGCYCVRLVVTRMPVREAKYRGRCQKM